MAKYLFDKKVYLNYLKRIKDPYRDGTSSMASSNARSESPITNDKNWNQELEEMFVNKLTDQMKKSHIPHPKERHIGWKSIKWLPNVREFKIEVGVLDKLFMKHNVLKKTKAILAFKPHVNKSKNRYILHQFKRMDESLRHQKYELYFTIAKRLITKSTIFMTMAIQHIFTGWYKNKNLKEIFTTAVKVRKLASLTFPKIEFSRVYIAKPGKEFAFGSVRPLGVPKPEWRVYLHMWSVILSFFMEATQSIDKAQHGFRPTRGTVSAWKEVIKNVLPSKNIYELDFKGYFDSIKLSKIGEKLINVGIPKEVVEMLIEMHEAGAELPDELMMDESAAQVKNFISKNSWGIMYNKSEYNIKGVPQGSPTSPLLSTLILTQDLFKEFGKALFYADDVLLYDVIKEPYCTEEMKELGLSIENKKSGWIRKDGAWLKQLKFLGLSYNGLSNRLEAKTAVRKEGQTASTLTFDKTDLINALAVRKAKDTRNKYTDTNDMGNWMNLITSGAMGFVMSRLYGDNWNPERVEPIEERIHKKSWTASKILKAIITKRYKIELNLYNESSFAVEWLADSLKGRLPRVKLSNVDDEWESILKVVENTQGHSWENLTKKALETVDKKKKEDAHIKPEEVEEVKQTNLDPDEITKVNTYQCLYLYGLMTGIFIAIITLNGLNIPEIVLDPIQNLEKSMTQISHEEAVMWSKASKSRILSELTATTNCLVLDTKWGANPDLLVYGRTQQGIAVWPYFILAGIGIICAAMLYDQIIDTWTIIDYVDLQNEPALRINQDWGVNLIWPITLEEYVNLEGYIRVELWIQNQLATNGELWTAMDWG